MKEETIVRINELTNKENLTLLTMLDKNTPSKGLTIKFKCNNCGLEFERSIKTVLDEHKGCLCQKCNSLNILNTALVSLYGKNPYKILKYTDSKSEVEAECLDCHSIITFKNQRQMLNNHNYPEGCHPCKVCSNNRNYKKDIKEFEDYLTNKFGSCNYTFPNPEEYAGLSSKKNIHVVCKFCGHEMYTLPVNIISPSNGKHYCRVCNNKDRLLDNMDYKTRCLKVTNGQIEPVEEYIDSRTPIRHKCNVCGYGTKEDWFKIPVKNTTRNAGCPRCSKINTISSAEDEIYEYIKSLDSELEIKRNVRDVLPNKQELDLYVPTKKVAIEHNGLYWHSEGYKGKDYHYNKMLEAKKIGIHLVQIFEDEWTNKKDICKNKIKSILGYNSTKQIYARKCTVENISAPDKNDFLNKYHIQGKDSAGIYKCLKYNNEVVAVMTFCRPRVCFNKKGNKDGVYELSRYATAYHVVGGFSKLLKTIINENPDIKTVETFADLRWSNPLSNVYLKNGYTEVHMTRPNYWYFDKNKTPSKREHRFNYRKQELSKKFPEFYDDKLTEFQIMDKTSYRRIWDCGNILYRFEVKR